MRRGENRKYVRRKSAAEMLQDDNWKRKKERGLCPIGPAMVLCTTVWLRPPPDTVGADKRVRPLVFLVGEVPPKFISFVRAPSLPVVSSLW